MHGGIPLHHPHAGGLEGRADGVAVVEGLPDAAEGGGVDDHRRLAAGGALRLEALEQRRVGLLGRGGGVVEEGEEAVGGGGEGDDVVVEGAGAEVGVVVVQEVGRAAPHS